MRYCQGIVDALRGVEVKRRWNGSIAICAFAKGADCDCNRWTVAAVGAETGL